MCGISGIIHFDKERKVNELKLRAMTDQIAHRGPDGEGFFMKDNVGLGHRRLSIIDLSTGDQPMIDDNQNVIVFNGEIYNYLELRDELKQLGESFKTNSDTEVILKAYNVWGVECQNKFNGMWAFALWDHKAQHLLLSRDRLGEKPLHYAVSDNTLIFCSEIKGIINFGVPAIPDPQLLEIYLSVGFIPAPYSFFKNVKKLEPGNCLLVKRNIITKSAYWSLPDIAENDLITDESHICNDFQHLFEDAVHIRMRSDVPFGAFLSGGLDSGSIVSIMKNFSKNQVETFTIGFNETKYDERDLAATVAERFQTQHYEKIVSHDSLGSALEKILFHYDEPFSDPAAIPTGYLCEFASNSVKMVLTGDGGDEVLSGYKAYRGERFAELYQQLPLLLQRSIPTITSRMATQLKGSYRYKINRVNRIVSDANSDFSSRLLGKFPLPGTLKISNLLTQEALSIEDLINDSLATCRFKDPFYKLMYYQLKVSLPDRMLVKVDRMSMAHSLETRLPFLDHRLVELMYKAHKRVKMPNFRLKSVLRKTIGKNLPASVLSQNKRGFNVPLREWINGDIFQEHFESVNHSDFGLNDTAVKSIVSNHKGGNIDCSMMLWRILVYQKWISSLQSISLKI